MNTLAIARLMHAIQSEVLWLEKEIKTLSQFIKENKLDHADFEKTLQEYINAANQLKELIPILDNSKWETIKEKFKH